MSPKRKKGRPVQGGLSSAEERYRFLYEHNPAMYFTVDAKGTVLSVNRFGAEQLGYAVDDLVGRSVLDVFYAEDRSQVLEQLETCIRRPNETCTWEIRKSRKDGSMLWVKELARATLDSDGRMVVLIVCEEITERKLAEEQMRENNVELERRVGERANELRESEARLRAIYDTAGVGIAVVDREGRFRQVNPALAEMLAYSAEELCSLTVPDVTHPDDIARTLESIEGMKTTPPITSFKTDKRYMRKDGSYFWGRVNVKYVSGPDGGVRYGVAIIEDISERKAMEQKIRGQTSELARRVEERTAKIQELERQRTESEKLAAAGRMAARVAHEINNPLAGIKNSFLLLKGSIPSTDRYYPYVARIEKEIDRIAGIVRQMYKLYKPLQESRQAFPLDEVIGDVVSLLQVGSREHDVALHAATEPTDAIVDMPEGLLRQVLFNLVQNAIEASSPGSTVEIRAAVNQNGVQVSVTDHGTGISRENRDRIFEPFFTTKDDETNAGLGLGLSVTKSIVEAMKGSLIYESEVGRGTTFQATLPTGMFPQRADDASTLVSPTP